MPTNRKSGTEYIHLPDGLGYLTIGAGRIKLESREMYFRLREFISRTNNSYAVVEYEPVQPLGDNAPLPHGLAETLPGDYVCIRAKEYEELQQVKTRVLRELAELREEIEKFDKGELPIH